MFVLFFSFVRRSCVYRGILQTQLSCRYQCTWYWPFKVYSNYFQLIIHAENEKYFVTSLLTKNWAIVLVVLCQKCFSLVLTFSAHIKKGVSVHICSHSILIRSNPRLVRLADWPHWQDPTTHRSLTVTRHQLCFPQNTTAQRKTRSQCN